MSFYVGIHCPHNVVQWHRRVKLFEGNPTKKILIYTKAVRTIDLMKAVGKPHTLWVAFAKLYETYKDLANALVLFDKAIQVNYKTVDHLASVWVEWAKIELRHKNFKGALELMRRATTKPSIEVKNRGAADENESVQMKLLQSVVIWKKLGYGCMMQSLLQSCSMFNHIPMVVSPYVGSQFYRPNGVVGSIKGLWYLMREGCMQVLASTQSLRLWTNYVDLEESLGTLDSAQTVYDRILD
ncbi:hypothetical protein QQP08_013689 [Theobroma cacao]|nr:hypothetical protein QQP08_013689 [Theobroma cacao]